jgi:hypothetical protein
MGWRIDWGDSHTPVLRGFCALPMAIAKRLCEAIAHFAATGRGGELHPRDPRRVRVRVPGAEASLYLDFDEKVVHVTGFYRRR